MNNTNHAVTSSLDGTRTAENLKQAFSKEAEAFLKSILFAELADDDGDFSAMRALSEISENDKRHAELWLGYLDELGDTFENLSELSVLKDALSGDIYPFMAEIADEEGFDEIAEKMRLVSAVKNSQSNILKDERERIASADALYSENPEVIWHCRYCGYDIKGNMPPERCPLCSYPQSGFGQLTKAE